MPVGPQGGLPDVGTQEAMLLPALRRGAGGKSTRSGRVLEAAQLMLGDSTEPAALSQARVGRGRGLTHTVLQQALLVFEWRKQLSWT